MSLSEPVFERISNIVAGSHVVLFMKGSRWMPQCGFSAQVVQILDEHLQDYQAVDVLRDPELREGIKAFSEWPTIPQLYVGGQFVGGCDIVRDLHASGELENLLGDPAEPATPTMTVTDEAARAFEAALDEFTGEQLRLAIDAHHRPDFYFGPRAPGDVEVDTGRVTLLLDRPSARRAQGISIDYVDGPNGGFRVNNPNASRE